MTVLPEAVRLLDCRQYYWAGKVYPTTQDEYDTYHFDWGDTVSLFTKF